MTAKDYILAHKDRFIEELKAWLRIPSISMDHHYASSIQEAARFVRDRLEEAGADTATIHETKGHPTVYAEKQVDPLAPTVLIYGHYDVQPADPHEAWTTPPFDPHERHGKLYARGAADDKGQVYIHIKAMEALVRTNTLPCNLKFIIEGEEEIGSANLAAFLSAHKARLETDAILISDTSILGNDCPSITTGVRGVVCFEVDVKGPRQDLHSGTYGGAVDNPLYVLSRMLAALKDAEGRIAIPHFYDDVITLDPEEREQIAKIPFDQAAYRKPLGVPALFGEKGYTPLEHTGTRPSLDIHGLYGGYMDEGAKTIIPARAGAKLSMRLVPNQQSHTISKLFCTYFEQLAPSTVQVSIKHFHTCEPIWLNTKSVAYAAAEKAMEQAWGKRPVPVRCGGSIPIVPLFKEKLGHAPVLMGFGLDSDNIHSVDESFGIENFFRGMDAVLAFLKCFREGKAGLENNPNL